MMQNNGDPAAVKATQMKISTGRLQAGWQGAKKFIPGTQGWKERRDENQQRKAMNDELGRAKVRGSSEKEDHGSVSKGGDSDYDTGSHFTEFQVELVDSLRRSFPRMEDAGTRASEIRDTLTDPDFISAVLDQQSTVTPREAVDGASAQFMMEIRKNLAEQLSAKVVQPLSAQHLEVLFSAMVGKLSRRVGSQEVHFWDKEEWHQKGKLTPDEAFFAFLERSALKRPADQRGDYIGAVLKSISEQRAVGKLDKKTKTTLMDPRHVDSYLRRHSDKPIETTVSDFKNCVRDLLTLPSTELHPVLGVPGLGFDAPIHRRSTELRRELEEVQGKDAKREAEIKRELASLRGYPPEQIDRERRVLGYVDSQVRTLETNFREFFLRRDKIMHVDTIPDEFSHYTNPEMATILEEVDKILRDREPLLAEMASVDGELRTLGGSENQDVVAPLRERAERRVVAVKRELEKVGRSVEALASLVRRANLPDEVKRELGEIVNDLNETIISNDSISAKKAKVVEKYGHPFKKAAKLAIDRLMERSKYSVKEVPDLEWIQARVIYEDTGKTVDDAFVPQEGFWARMDRWFTREVLSFRFIPRLISWAFWNGSIKNAGTQNGRLVLKTTALDFVHGAERIENRDRDNVLNPEKPHAKILGIIPYYRAMRGVMKLATIAFLGYTGYVAYASGEGLNHYTASEPGNWKLWVVGKSRILRPWQWLYAVPKTRTRERVIDDSYDIPQRLAGRGAQYYMDQYNVTNQENLRWLQGHPEVLTFMQERITRRRVVEWKEWKKDDPGICSNKKTITIPDNCKLLGVTSLEAAEKYNEGNIDRDDGWEKGGTLCCTIEINYEDLDNRMLNKGKADTFVEYLRSQEDSGVEVNTAYLNDDDNMLTWSTERFLVPTAEYVMMGRYGITDEANAEFVVAQKAGIEAVEVDGLKIGDYTTRGNAPKYLKPEARDAFFTAYRERVTTEGIDPTMDTVPTEKLQTEFESLLVEKEGLFEDTSDEYRKTLAKRKMELLGIDTQTGIDIYTTPTNGDIRKLLDGFLEGTDRIDPARGDELVVFLSKEKARGTDLSRYSPPEGDRVEVLRNKGFLMGAPSFESANQSKGADTVDAAAVNAYYAKYSDFGGFLDALIDQELSNEAVLGKFGGDRNTAKEVIRADIQRILESDHRADVSRRQSWGVSVQDDKISFDAVKSRTGIGGRIRQIANAQNN